MPGNKQVIRIHYVVESQLSQLRIKKEAIRQATQQIHQDIQFKE